MAAHKQRKFSSRGRSPAPESRQTDSAPIRATVPLIEQYYVAVDRQLKSGFGTYEAAEKAAKEIKKKHPNPQEGALIAGQFGSSCQLRFQGSSRGCRDFSFFVAVGDDFEGHGKASISRSK